MFRILEESGYYCWKASCKFPLVTANTKVEGAVIGPKSQKKVFSTWCARHSKDSAAEPLM